MRLSDGELRGRTVITADGLAIGEVTEFFLQGQDLRVESLVIKLRRNIADQLGASRGRFHASTIEIPGRMVQSVGDAILLAVPVEGLRGLLPGATAEPAPAH